MVLLVIGIRGFVAEPFKIPSPSMVPTLLVGDYIFVKRFAYGLRVPFTKFWLLEFSEPHRGDVVVFTYPEDESLDFIKRVVGVPGDKIAMRAGELYLNGKAVEHKDFTVASADHEDNCQAILSDETNSVVPDNLKPVPYLRDARYAMQKVEYLEDAPAHFIQHTVQSDDNPADFEITVPERSYFVMGDNRDHSMDSRFWGFVPRENLKGRALFIWLSFNDEKVKCRGGLKGLNMRWHRFGRGIR